MSRLHVTKKRGQGLQIGKDIEIFLLNVLGKQARLLIKAPNNVPINHFEFDVNILKKNKYIRGNEDGYENDKNQ